MAEIIQLYAWDAAYNDLRIHPKCEEEIRYIVEKDGRREKFESDYKIRLDYLHEHREKAVLHRAWFEKLSNAGSSLYSMHIATINNMRILYIFTEPYIIFLCAFSEKSKKKKTDSYAAYIPIALSRIQELEEWINEH